MEEVPAEEAAILAATGCHCVLLAALCSAWLPRSAIPSCPCLPLEGDGSSSDFLAALSSVVLPREAHIDVQRSGFVLLSFSSVSRGASPKGRSACARRPKTSRAVCLECPPLAGCFQLACGVKRLRCSGEQRVCFAAPGVSPLAAHPCTTDWPIQMGL